MELSSLMSFDMATAIAKPDAEAAVWLDQRMKCWSKIDEIYEHSFSERLVITREFEKRSLWKYLIDPDTGEYFPNLTSWLSCSTYLGCRRTNFEAKRLSVMLEDVPSEKLIDIPKHNLQTLTLLSTAVRNQDDVLEAAKTMKPESFEQKIEVEHPHQHLQARKPFNLRYGKSDRRIVDKWIEYAIEHDIAGTKEEAILRACEMAQHVAELEEELAQMPEEQPEATIH